MGDISTMSSGILDKNGIDIHLGDMVRYHDQEYIILEDEKDSSPWICHPSGSNPEIEDLILEEIADEVEIV